LPRVSGQEVKKAIIPRMIVQEKLKKMCIPVARDRVFGSHTTINNSGRTNNYSQFSTERGSYGAVFKGENT
jgi:hypothetical protein